MVDENHSDNQDDILRLFGTESEGTVLPTTGPAGEISGNALDIAKPILESLCETVATAESLTAGLLAVTITNIPGASSFFRGGVVTYATDTKHLLADVDMAILDKHGPVSRETARAMAWGVHNRAESTWAVSLTGVAGPSTQDGHPVGEVWCGICTPTTEDLDGVLVKRFLFDPAGGRKGIRNAAVNQALKLLEGLVKHHLEVIVGAGR